MHPLTLPGAGPCAPAEDGLGLRLGDGRLQALDRVGPFPVHRVRGDRDRSVDLGPRPAGSWAERNVLELGPGQAALDLEVGLGGAGEELLPATPAGTVAPSEQLPPTEPSGGHLQQPDAGRIDRRDPGEPPGVQLEEVVGGPRRRKRIGGVGPAGPRHADAKEPSRVGELERRAAGDHDPGAGGARDRHVRPPVDRHGMGTRVGHLDIDRKAARSGSQPEVHLVDKLTHTLPFVDPKAWGAIGELEGSCVDRRTCQCRMPCGSQIPLDSAREPGISQPEIAELYPVTVVKELSRIDLVLKRPEPATKVQKNNGE